MMYLGETIIDEAGKAWAMAGVLHSTTSMQVKKLSLGYRTMAIGEQELKGHEFHYSQFAGEPAPVFYQPNIFASYSHWYWGENFAPIERWLTS
jgi:cobyrinic acid a,c-diamide synthase